MASTQDIPVPPVPNQQNILEETPGSTKVSVPWTQWFVQVRDKINILNSSIVNLAGVSGTGFLSKDGTSWFLRTFTGTSGRISVSNNTGAAGDPQIDLVDTPVTPGSYTNTNLTVGADGRIITASNGSNGGASWTQLGTYSFSTDGSISTKDFISIGSYQEFMVIGRGITTTASANISVMASVDNGVSFFSTSGDYVLLSSTSTESNSTMLCSSGTATSSAKSPVFFITGNIAGQTPYGRCDASNQSILFIASTSGINALRIGAPSSTMTGGAYTLYGR